MRRPARTAHLAITLAALLLSGLASAQTQPIVTTDLLKIRQVTAIDIARDASKVVFAVRSIAAESNTGGRGGNGGKGDDDRDGQARPSYAYRSHLYMLDLTDPEARPFQLTHGDRNDASPVISPDGRTIAFVRGGANDDGEESAQVWILPLNGGEARQVSTLEHGAFNPLWSPDGRRLLVSSSIPMSDLEGSPLWPGERPRRQWGDAALGEGRTARPDGSKEEIRAWLERNADDFNPFVINRIAFQGEHGLREEMNFTHLFLHDPSDAAAEPTRITSGFYDHNSPAFVPDGRGIVYAASKFDDAHPDRIHPTTIWAMELDGSNDRQVLAIDGYTLSSPRPGPDGRLLAFTGEMMDEPVFRQSQLGLATLAGDGAEPLWLTDEQVYDSSVFDFEWSGTGIELLFNSAWQGGAPLMLISEGLLEPAAIVERDELGPVGVTAFDVAGKLVVYAVTSPRNPNVLRIIDSVGDRLAMDLNEWVRDKTLSTPREHWISRPDGLRVQSWVMEPTNREPGQRYPVCLEMHGGPAAMWGPGEYSMWHEFQLLCSWGYGVVYANPRGSGGYGYAFQKGNYQNWGEGPAGDVLAALDQAIADNSWMDRERLVVTGGSYAGYLTGWIVGHDHRFKAAVAQRGVYDLETFFGEGNAWRLANWAMGGYPWDAKARAIYRRESPFTDVNRIQTPLLIMHASNDLRTGVSQSEMMYRALKELEREVEYIRYPRAGHDLSRTGDPHQRLDRLNRIIEFFERYIDNPRPAPQATVSAGE